jgi:hypothetical protein
MIDCKSINNWWNDVFYSETSPTGLGLFRILFGSLNILNAASLIPDAITWYGVNAGSTLPLKLSQTMYHGFRINIFNWLAPSDIAMWMILIGYLIASIGQTIGFKTKISNIATFILLISLQNRNFMILNSGDTVLKCLCFLMMFSPVGEALSVDSWLRFKRTGLKPRMIPVTTIRLMQIQFSLVYLATFWFKTYGELWVDGTATYYTSRLLSFQRVVIPGIFDHLWSIKMMTWSALAIEFALGTLIWVKEFRYWVVLAGIGLHIGIELTMTIGFFEWVMMFAFVLFVEPKHLEVYFIDPIKAAIKNAKLRTVLLIDKMQLKTGPIATLMAQLTKRV